MATWGEFEAADAELSRKSHASGSFSLGCPLLQLVPE